jgi:hypothetical protein
MKSPDIPGRFTYMDALKQRFAESQAPRDSRQRNDDSRMRTRNSQRRDRHDRQRHRPTQQPRHSAVEAHLRRMLDAHARGKDDERGDEG